jgi:hypothetical protein
MPLVAAARRDQAGAMRSSVLAIGRIVMERIGHAANTESELAFHFETSLAYASSFRIGQFADSYRD